MIDSPPVALSIAGSDSGGGAGIQADMRVFAGLAAFGTTAITALTAQSTQGISDVFPVPPSAVAAQIEAVVRDMHPVATKTGMLGGREVLDVVASCAQAGQLPNLVVDPVLASSGDHPLIERSAVGGYLTHLLPYAVVVTPNASEAAQLSGMEVASVEDMKQAGLRLLETGVQVVVVTGSEHGIDVVVDADGIDVLHGEPVVTRNTHGTGCTFSAAIAAFLAHGSSIREAVALAKRFVTAALQGAADWRIGAGSGPLDHMGAARRMALHA